MATKNRIEYIDFIKGVCIFIVVWGHSIQNMGDGNEFWENPIHEFICSFHMPIFMMISGFFFSKVIGKSLLPMIRARFTQLIVPCFGWSLILLMVTTGYLIYDGLPVSPLERVGTLIHETSTRFWFLRSVFICYVLAAVSIKMTAVVGIKESRRDIAAFLVSLLLFLLLPDNGRLHLDKFMYPFFWMGYFLHKHIDYILHHRMKLLGISLAVFALLLFVWKREYYIYVTGMSLYDLRNGHLVFHDLPNRLSVIFYRYLTGTAGSLFVFLLLQRLYHPCYRLIEKVGSYTLGIYTIHIIIEGNILSHFDLLHSGFWVYNFVITPIVSIALIVLCIGILRILEKYRYSKWLFLGKTTL